MLDMLIIQLAIIFLAAKLAGHLSVRIGQPSVLGQLAIGILIGPAVLGLVDESEIMKELSTIGVILLMFLAGLETDLKEFKKSAKAATFVGFGGIILPFIGGYYSGVILGLGMLKSLFFGLVLTATSVSITVQVLREMGKLKSKEGMAILGAAVLDDIVVIILLAFLMSFMGEEVSIGMVVAKKLLFFFIAILAAWKVVPWLIQKLAAMRVPQASVGAAITICFVFAYFAELTGVAAFIGAYIAGMAIGSTSYGHTIMEKTEIVSYSFFVPIFFVSVGFSAQVDGVGTYFWLVIPLGLLAIFTKLIGSGVGAKLAGYEWKSSLRVGAGMVSRGEVALILAALGLEKGMIEPAMFTILIVVVLITTLVTPPLLKVMFREKQNEIINQNHSKVNTL
jgi:monovalent cation:proton antiporter-2 (CPA2) family protein